MVRHFHRRAESRRAALITELVVAMAILALVILPLSYGFWHEAKLTRAYYHRALAMEIVDGEMEVLAAGEWRAYREGTQVYPVALASSTNLPPGEFVLTIQPPLLRLAWQPRGKGSINSVVREVTLHETK
jgi:hypothetical protein